jgi:CheY-like chemotaxis protein
MEAVGQLTGGIAHDLNNILTVITGTIEILAEAVADRPELAAIAKLIDEAATRGGDLTQRLLAFARKQPLQPQEVDVNSLVIEAASMLRPTLGERVEIRMTLAGDTSRALIDPSQLTNALLNLSLNARDAMPDGGKLIIETCNVVLDDNYARVNVDVTAGSYVMIAVTDSGHGIPADILNHVFEPFFTTKDVGKGSGLGLSMVYGFTKQSDGHVAIYSEPGLGTTVRMYLPALPTKAKEAEPPRRGDVENHAPSGAETIFIVEDDPFVRSYAVMSLRSLGYRVTAAVDGNDALKQLGTDIHVDLLFTDIVMPGGINGWELADLARRARPELRVLLTSGYALETLNANGHLRDGSAILPKPYRKAELARRLREALSAPVSLGAAVRALRN